MGHTKNFIRYCHVADFGTRRRRRRLPPPLRVPSSQVRRCGPTPSPPRATPPTPPPTPRSQVAPPPFPFQLRSMTAHCLSFVFAGSSVCIFFGTFRTSPFPLFPLAASRRRSLSFLVHTHTQRHTQTQNELKITKKLFHYVDESERGRKNT